jgi:hypothetical protein
MLLLKVCTHSLLKFNLNTDIWQSLLFLGLFSATILSSPLPPTPNILTRQTKGAVCGDNSYSQDDINDAVNTGCSYYQNGETVGRNSYPHAENNYEDLPFAVSPPYLEFPIMADGTQFDGSEGPGPDRVVFDQNCNLAGTVTYTGAGGDNFQLCDYN